MMKCVRCGDLIPEDGSVCMRCGMKVRRNPATRPSGHAGAAHSQSPQTGDHGAPDGSDAHGVSPGYDDARQAFDYEELLARAEEHGPGHQEHSPETMTAPVTHAPGEWMAPVGVFAPGEVPPSLPRTPARSRADSSGRKTRVLATVLVAVGVLLVGAAACVYFFVLRPEGSSGPAATVEQFLQAAFKADIDTMMSLVAPGTVTETRLIYYCNSILSGVTADQVQNMDLSIKDIKLETDEQSEDTAVVKVMDFTVYNGGRKTPEPSARVRLLDKNMQETETPKMVVNLKKVNGHWLINEPIGGSYTSEPAYGQPAPAEAAPTPAVRGS